MKYLIDYIQPGWSPESTLVVTKSPTNNTTIARVAELVDAPDLKSVARTGVRVRVPPRAPINR